MRDWQSDHLQNASSCAAIGEDRRAEPLQSVGNQALRNIETA